VELAIYIKNLLYNHDCVIISGLGMLKTVYKPAEINSSQHTISPPSKTLTFDSGVSVSDQSLEKFIASQQHISEKKASKLISNQIALFLQKLEDGETIFWDGIGYFSKKDSVLRFEPEPDANFLTDSFGLSKIDYSPVEFRLSSKYSVVAHKKKSYAYAIMFLLIVLVIGGSIAIYLYYPDIQTKFKKLTQKTVTIEPVKIAEPVIKTPKDTAKQTDLEQFVDKSTDKKKALALKTAQGTPTIPEKTSYYIIAGSFKTFERASILAKQLKKEGYKPEIIEFEPNLFRVSLGEFKDKPEALKGLDKVKASKGDGAAWLLTKKI